MTAQKMLGCLVALVVICEYRTGSNMVRQESRTRRDADDRPQDGQRFDATTSRALMTCRVAVERLGCDRARVSRCRSATFLIERER